MSTDNLRPADIKCSAAFWTYGVKEPTSLKAERNLVMLAEWDRRLSPAARKVLAFIVDWEHDEHGGALASVRFIAAHLKARDPAGVGVSRRGVHQALAALVDAGWIECLHVGKGTRNASKYRVNHDALAEAAEGRFPAIVAPGAKIVANCPEDGDSVDLSRLPGQYCPDHGDSTGQNCPECGDKYTLTYAPKKAPYVSNEVAAGLAPEAPAASGGFDLIWKAYGRFGSKQASRKAFDAIVDPDVDLIAARAASWAASAKPGQRRMPLERWLAAEKYDEADRRVAAKPGRVSGTATIISVTETGSPFTQLYADIVMTDGAGKETTHRLHVGALGDDGSDAEIYRALHRKAPDGKLAGWTVDANTLAPISPPVEAAPPEPEQRPADPEPAPHPAEPDPILAPRQKKPKPQIEQREIPKDREGRKEMLARWRRNGFFDDGDAA